MVLSANPRFDELKATGKLPSPAGVALAVIELCRREGTAIDEIAHAVRADPALSGRVIKFANAAAHGPRRPVVSVPEAIRMVGVNTVRQLVLGFSLLGQYRAGACKAFDYGRFWSRSLAMAIAAHGLCQRVRGAQPDEAFTCGLLAGVGNLALVTLYPNEMGELLAAHAQKKATELTVAERERFAIDHNELGAALLEDWHLPRLFVSAVFHHETPEHARVPEGSREFVIGHVLHLAARLADFCVAREDDRKARIPELILAAAKTGLEETGLAKLCDETVVQWQDWGKILEVKTQDVPAFEGARRGKTRAGSPHDGAASSGADAAHHPGGRRRSLDTDRAGASAARARAHCAHGAGRQERAAPARSACVRRSSSRTGSCRASTACRCAVRCATPRKASACTSSSCRPWNRTTSWWRRSSPASTTTSPSHSRRACWRRACAPVSG